MNFPLPGTRETQGAHSVFYSLFSISAVQIFDSLFRAELEDTGSVVLLTPATPPLGGRLTRPMCVRVSASRVCVRLAAVRKRTFRAATVDRVEEATEKKRKSKSTGAKRRGQPGPRSTGARASERARALNAQHLSAWDEERLSFEPFSLTLSPSLCCVASSRIASESIDARMEELRTATKLQTTPDSRCCALVVLLFRCALSAVFVGVEALRTLFNSAHIYGRSAPSWHSLSHSMHQDLSSHCVLCAAEPLSNPNQERGASSGARAFCVVGLLCIF